MSEEVTKNERRRIELVRMCFDEGVCFRRRCVDALIALIGIVREDEHDD